jgi:hypothetical protein
MSTQDFQIITAPSMEILKECMVSPALDFLAGLFVDTDPSITVVHCPLIFEFVNKLGGSFEDSKTGYIRVIHLMFLSPYRISINHSNVKVNGKNYRLDFFVSSKKPQVDDLASFLSCSNTLRRISLSL